MFRDQFGLVHERGLTELALMAVEASFASPETEAELRSEISSYAAMPAP